MSVVTLVTWWGTNAFLPFVVKHLAGPGADAATVAGLLTYATAIFNLGGFLGTLATIPLARLGRRALYALYLGGSALATWLVFGMVWEPVTRLRLLFFPGLTAFGVVGSFSFYLPELFPTRLRGTGAGFCYNVGRFIAAAGPFLVGTVAARGANSLQTAMQALFWVGVVPLAGAVVALTPVVIETKGRALG